MGRLACSASLWKLINTSKLPNAHSPTSVAGFLLANREFRTEAPLSNDGPAATDVSSYQFNNATPPIPFDQQVDQSTIRTCKPASPVGMLRAQSSQLSAWSSIHRHTHTVHYMPLSIRSAAPHTRIPHQEQQRDPSSITPTSTTTPANSALASTQHLLPTLGLGVATLASADPSVAMLSFMSPWGRGRFNLSSLMGDPSRMVTNAIIAANIAIFALDHLLAPGLMSQLLLYNYAVAHGEWWRLVTSAFTHYGFLHLLVNSISIHFVCPSVEAACGRSRFLALYLGSALACGLASYSLHSPYHAAAGSSGAILGMMGALVAYRVANRAHVFTSRDEILSLLQVIGLNLLIGYSGHSIDQVGHTGGLLGGAALMLLVGPRYRWVQDEYGYSKVVDKPILPIFGRGGSW